MIVTNITHTKMETKEIIEGNRLIAEFMGLNPNESNFYLGYHYDKNFGLLIEVVEKIESIKMGTIISVFEVIIKHKRCEIEAHPQWDYYGEKFKDIDIRAVSKIEATWLAVIEFIKWYNTQNK